MQTKKLTLVLTTLLLVISVSAQSTDSALIEEKVNNRWQAVALVILNYDNACRNTLHLQKNWDRDSQSWTNAYRTVNTFDLNGNMIETLEQYWNKTTNAWINSFREIYIYSDDGLKRTTTGQGAVNNNSWKTQWRYIDSLNAYGNVVYSITETAVNDTLQLTWRTIYTYNSNNFVTLIKEDGWTNNTWIKSQKTDYYYSDDGLRGKQTQYRWDSDGETWITDFRESTNFLQGTNIIESGLAQRYISNSWVNNLRYQITYNEDNLRTFDISQYWDTKLNKWTNTHRAKWDYYSDGSIYHQYFEVWNTTTNSWDELSRSTYTHHGCIFQLDITRSTETKDNAFAKGLTRTEKFNITNHNNAQTHNNSLLEIQIPENIKNRSNQYSYNMIINSNNHIGMKDNISYKIVITAKPSVKSTESISSNFDLRLKTPQFIISPNPAKNYLIVTPPDNTKPGETVLKLFDMSGKLILNKKLGTAGAQKIYLPLLTQGIYIITLTSANGIQKQKLLVQ